MIKFRIIEEVRDDNSRAFFPKVSSNGQEWFPVSDFMGDQGICPTFEGALEEIRKYQIVNPLLSGPIIHEIPSELTQKQFDNIVKIYYTP